MTSLLDLLLPAACCGCGRMAGILCAACQAGFEPAGSVLHRFVAADPGVVIGESFVVTIAAYTHDGHLRKALERLKYAGAGRVAAPLAESAVPALRRLHDISGPAVLVPVPIHPTRLRQRGYNQAALLATALGRGASLPVRELLVRARETTKQHRLDRVARLRNLKDAFAVTAEPPAQPVIIVDDIVTTSATLEACAAALRNAGSGEVYGFAVAREI